MGAKWSGNGRLWRANSGGQKWKCANRNTKERNPSFLKCMSRFLEYRRVSLKCRRVFLKCRRECRRVSKWEKSYPSALLSFLIDFGKQVSFGTFLENLFLSQITLEISKFLSKKTCKTDLVSISSNRNFRFPFLPKLLHQGRLGLYKMPKENQHPHTLTRPNAI